LAQHATTDRAENSFKQHKKFFPKPPQNPPVARRNDGAVKPATTGAVVAI
jgi:hypothetical protein